MTVGVAATLLADAGGEEAGFQVTIINAGAAAVDVGDQTVTSGTGFPVAPAAQEQFALGQGDRLYGIVASGTAVVDVLITRGS